MKDLQTTHVGKGAYRGMLIAGWETTLTRCPPCAPSGAAFAEQFNRGDKYQFLMGGAFREAAARFAFQHKPTSKSKIAGESLKLAARKELETFPRLRDCASLGGGQFPAEWNPYITTHPESYSERARINQAKSVSSPAPDEGRAVTIHTASEYTAANKSGVGTAPRAKYMRNGIQTGH